MNIRTRATAVLAAGAVIALGATGTANAGQVSGAIFTTTVDGSIVNENVHYEAKEDVYLDGGPGPNAPSGAAGLPEGDYYFQVTDPSGQDLLSTDHISCRMVHVNENGVIDIVYSGSNLEKIQGTWTAVSCQHNQGIDIDHSELGAITVQLYPYDDTPNPGGVYKVWMTPVAYYSGTEPDCEGNTGKCNVNGENWQPGNFHGFIPAWSKTDNYKVKEPGKPYDPPEITVRKFHDKNFNGTQDEGESDVTGWLVTTTDPLGVITDEYTHAIIVADTGTYFFAEDTPAGTQQTVSYLDGLIVSLYPAADPVVQLVVSGDSGETHEVVFGNVGLGSFKACKVYDRDGDGVPDAGEPPVVGWKLQLDGEDLSGVVVGPTVQTTGADGCTTFSDLMPGTYTVTELFPTGNWTPTGDTSSTQDIVSSLTGGDISGSILNATFTNVCTDTADLGTKGYWHNKNGLQEIDPAFVTGYVNLLDPYNNPTSYFGDGDEPFDGFFADSTQVDAAFNSDDGSFIWGAGTLQAEVSHFLVDANAGGDPREQLAQQLLAFIFNTEYRLGGDGLIELPGGTWILASDLITAAIAVWQSGTAAEQNAMQELLNGFNESDALPFVPSTPCAVSYD